MNPESTPTANETANANPDNRTANGRFGKGNRGGPGNPFARQTARLRQALVDAVSPDDIKAVADGLKKKAVEGDVAAAKLLMSYCVGKEDPDRLDQHELKTIVDNHLDSAEGPLNVVKGMPLDVLVEMFRLILPVLRSEKVKMAKKVLCAPLTEEEIEDNQDDEDDEASKDDEAAPAYDPFANIPEWMQHIGKESEQTAEEQAAEAPARKRKQGSRVQPAKHAEAPRPREAEVDAELLRVLLERARHLAGQTASDHANIDGQPAAQAADRPLHHPEAQAREALPRTLDVPPPSTNGRNGKRPPSANGSNGKK